MIDSEKIPTLFSKDLLEDPDFIKFQEIAKDQIWSQCWSYTVVEICFDINTDKVCATLRLFGIKLDRICSNWTRSGDILKASIGLGTQNSGVYKLSDPRVNIEYNTKNKKGKVTFKSKLEKLTWRGYKVDKEWDNETILTW